jgi:superfamily II DNA/RNA helicase
MRQVIMSSQSDFALELKRDISNDRVALILGAGVSAAASENAPNSTWKSLLANALDFFSREDEPQIDAFKTILKETSDTDALVAVAQFVQSKFAPIQGEYESWLRRTVGNLTLLNHELIDALPSTDVILTTNYDDLVESATGRQPLTWTSRNAFNEYPRAKKTYVFHLHGYFNEPTSVILGGVDYGRLEQNEHVQELLRNLARNHSFLIVGSGAGLDDPNFSKLIDWLKREQGTSPYRHYLLVSEQHAGESPYYESLAARVTPIIYGSDHCDLPKFLRGLNPQHPQANSASLATARELSSDASTADVGAKSSQGLEARLGAILPEPIVRKVERELGPLHELDEFQSKALRLCIDIIETRQSGLLCAVTGTGKTTIARLAMNIVISHRKAGIQLLPTKALVAQEVSNWNGWANIWAHAAERAIRVYGSSRDYPQNDRPVSRGRYEVAVAIYEKLGVYLVSGRTPLANTSLAVVDELQMLVENSSRAAKLEAILTNLRLMPPALRPAILGLSATLPPDSTEALRKWLDIGETMTVTTNRRPVPLDAYVVDALGWKKQSDAHLFNIPGELPPPVTDYTEHHLGKKLRQNKDALAGKIPHLASGELAATLIDDLLQSDQSRRIICFVPSRTAAQEVASGVQALQKKRLGRIHRGSPWIVGRYAQTAKPVDANRKYNSLKFSDLPNCDDVLRGLREGIAFHTAAVPAALRRLLESEFLREDGLLRVLIATDTLAVGVNLPADTVIATSLSGYGGYPRAKRLLPPSDLDNKAGRAGRRGQTKRARGEFYILVPGTTELQDVEGLTTNDIRDLASVEGVFNSFVTAPRRTNAISSKYRSVAEISSLVLQVLCQDGFSREPQAWLQRTKEIISGLLLAFEDNSTLPEAEEVLSELSARRLIGTKSNGKIALSGLGAALARSSLDLDAAGTLEQIARLACANAGHMDLLWNTCRSSTIQTVTDWVSLPPVANRHYPSMKEAALNLANAYCADEEHVRRYCAQMCKSTRRPPPESLVAQGSTVVSPELRDLLSQTGEGASDADITALLRALVAFEWSRGIPFGDIKARFSRAISSEEVQRGEAPVEFKMYYSDVEQLCEQVAGLLSGAADISFSTDGFDYSSRVRSLAAEVEVGLPAWLGPIARMRTPTLHRERLTFLWQDDPPDSLSEILERSELKQNEGISDEDLATSRREIEIREEEERAYRNRVAQKWANVVVPGADGDTFEDVSDQLDESATSVDYLRVLGGLAEGMKVEVGPPTSSECFAQTSWQAGAHRVLIFVPHESLSRRAVEQVAMQDGLVVLRTRTEPGGIAAVAAPTRARFVQPEHVLSLLANLVLARSRGLDAEEVVEGLSRICVSSIDSESWYLYGSEVLEAPPPFVGPLPRMQTAPNVASADEDLMD